MTSKKPRGLKDYLLAHKGNNFKPFLFTGGVIGIVLALLLLVQAAYILQTTVVSNKTNFLASVLPGALASLTNQDRIKNGIDTLERDEALDRAAQLKAEDMAEKGYFSHVDPAGNAPWYWFKEVGYEYIYAGENLAVNFTDSAEVEEAWMNSPTHRANIVKQQYTNVGFGVAHGKYEGKDATFVVQFFAKPVEHVSLNTQTAAIALSGQDAPESSKKQTEEKTVIKEDTSEKVLGITDVAPEDAEDNFSKWNSTYEKLATSPTKIFVYLLTVVLIIFVFALIIALLSHAQVKYLEVLGGGLLVILIVLGMLLYAVLSKSEPIVPDTTDATNTIVIE